MQTALILLIIVLALCVPVLAYEPVSLMPNGYLGTPDGKAFIPMGGFYANWTGNGKAKDRVILPPHDIMPPGARPYLYPFSRKQETDIKDWFQYCRDNGVTALRLMFRGMDTVGRVHPTKLEAVLRYMELARPYGLRFQVVLFEDFDKPPYVNEGNLEIFISEYKPEELANLPAHRKRFLVEKRLASNKYTDPDAIQCQKEYLRELIPAIMDRPEIFAYEFENEAVGTPVEWLSEMVKEIRRIDPDRLIIANPVDISVPVSLRWSKTGIDLLNYHPYQHGNPHTGTNAYYMARAKQHGVTVPIYSGEAGLNTTTGDKVPEVEAALLARDNIWNGILGGYIGSFMWVPQFKGEVDEHRMATTILEAFDLGSFVRKQPEIAVVLPVLEKEMEKEHLHPMMAWAEFAQNTGHDFDFTMDPAEKRAVVVPLATRPADVDLSKVRAPFATTPGYLIQYLLSADERKALVLLANRAGGMKAGVTNAWQRSKQPANCRLKLDLPRGRYRLTIYNLDREDEVRTKQSLGTGWTTFGKTQDDLVILIERTD